MSEIETTATETTGKRDKESIILGSGDLYYQAFTDEVPDIDSLCVNDNLIGAIQGGATIEYSPSFYTASDDSGKLKKTVLTEENATLKTGLMSLIGKRLEQICSTARADTETESGKRIVKIGGVGNFDNTKYVWCFHHTDNVDGDIWVLVVGLNTSGFTLAFQRDKETVVDVEITCEPQDEDGTLIQYIEEIGSIAADDEEDENDSPD